MSTSISATGNVYIRQDPSMNIQYSSDNSSWTTLSKERPIGVSNTNLNINSILKRLIHRRIYYYYCYYYYYYYEHAHAYTI